MSMNLEIDEHKGEIHIKDNVRTNYLLIQLILGLNLVNAIINLSFTDYSSLGWMDYLWMFVAVFSLIVLFYFLTKKSIASTLSIDAITSLKEKNKYGVSRFSLKLKNGKSRDLSSISDPKVAKDLVALFKRLKVTHIKGTSH